MPDPQMRDWREELARNGEAVQRDIAALMRNAYLLAARPASRRLACTLNATFGELLAELSGHPAPVPVDVTGTGSFALPKFSFGGAALVVNPVLHAEAVVTKADLELEVHHAEPDTRLAVNVAAIILLFVLATMYGVPAAERAALDHCLTVTGTFMPIAGWLWVHRKDGKLPKHCTL
jgi:hypothetical protein